MKKKIRDAKNMRHTTSATVIAHCIIMLTVFSMFSYSLFFFLTDKNPKKEELIYEECTFLGYKFIDKKSDYYNIFVKEYNIPLVIDNIVYNKTNLNALINLKKGDTVTVSLRAFKDTRDIYEMYCGEKYILSYEDYLDAHSENADGMIKISVVFMVLSLGIVVWEIVHYKRTGRALPWPRY